MKDRLAAETAKERGQVEPAAETAEIERMMAETQARPTHLE